MALVAALIGYQNNDRNNLDVIAKLFFFVPSRQPMEMQDFMRSRDVLQCEGENKDNVDFVIFMCYIYLKEKHDQVDANIADVVHTRMFPLVTQRRSNVIISE